MSAHSLRTRVVAPGKESSRGPLVNTMLTDDRIVTRTVVLRSTLPSRALLQARSEVVDRRTRASLLQLPVTSPCAVKDTMELVQKICFGLSFRSLDSNVQ
jgi:hypothetical protein